MKTLLKTIATWIISCFNVTLYLDSELDSIVLSLYHLEIKEQAMQLADIYRHIQLIESFKCFFMLLSVAFLFLANKETIYDSTLWCLKQATKFTRTIAYHYARIKRIITQKIKSFTQTPNSKKK
jgi:hypothetical protein